MFTSDWSNKYVIEITHKLIAHLSMVAVLPRKQYVTICLRLPHCKQTHMTHSPFRLRKRNKDFRTLHCQATKMVYSFQSFLRWLLAPSFLVNISSRMRKFTNKAKQSWLLDSRFKVFKIVCWRAVIFRYSLWIKSCKNSAKNLNNAIMKIIKQ